MSTQPVSTRPPVPVFEHVKRIVPGIVAWIVSILLFSQSSG